MEIRCPNGLRGDRGNYRRRWIKTNGKTQKQGKLDAGQPPEKGHATIGRRRGGHARKARKEGAAKTAIKNATTETTNGMH